MTRTPAALLLALLLAVPQGLAQLPSSPPNPETGEQLVDDELGNLYPLANSAYAFGYDRGSEAAEQLVGEVPKDNIVLYHDGLGCDAPGSAACLAHGPDPASGVVGQWRQAGDAVWQPTNVTAPDGENTWVFASSNQTTGRYPLGASSFLISPPLDLRTGSKTETCREQAPDSAEGASCSRTEENARLSFLYRHNLGHKQDEERDHVQILFLNAVGRKQILEDAANGDPPTCGTGCSPWSSFGVYDGDMRTLRWTPYDLDMTPFIGQQVWVAFRFVSLPAPTGFTPSNYFASPAYFDQQAGFHGFQLDELRLEGPVPPANLQAGWMVEPSHTLPACGGVVCFDTKEPIPVLGFVRNAGGTAVRAHVTVRLTNDTGSVAACHKAGSPALVPCDFDFDLAPGAASPIAVTFEPQNESQDWAARVEAAPVHASPEEGAFQDPPEDNGEEVAFWVLHLDQVTLTRPRLQGAWGELHKPFNVTATLRNEGTANRTVRVLAKVLDVRHNHSAAEGMLDPADRDRTHDLGPGEAKNLTWIVKAGEPGQFMFFVRTHGQPDFSPERDLGGRTVPRLDVPLRSGTIVADGDLADWPAPADTLTETLGFQAATGETHNVEVRAFHDGAVLNLALTVAGPPPPDLQSQQEQDIAVRLDDLADLSFAPSAEGGAVAGSFDPAGSAAVHQAQVYDGAGGWRPAPFSNASRESEDGQWANVAGRYDVQDAQGQRRNYTYEVRQPIAGAGLAAKAGDQVGLHARVHDLVTRQDPAGPVVTLDRTVAYPPDSVGVDGEGPADGTLSDEAATWATLKLGGGVGLSGFRDWTSAFGVGLSPPVQVLFDSTQGCPQGFAARLPGGWKAGNVTVKGGSTDGKDQWNCSFYAPEGRTLIYEGLSPASTCSGLPCPPYSASAGHYTPTGFHPGVGTQDGGKTVLETPPIRIPAVAYSPARPEASSQPVLLLHHQYATMVNFHDWNIPEDGSPQQRSNMRADSIAWVTAQPYDASGNPLGGEVYLVPEAGYSTQAREVPPDPSIGERNFFAEGGGNPTWAFFCDSNLNKHPGGTNGATSGIPNCGWWSPMGHIDGYRPPGESYPVGGGFQGSPWRFDRIPLYGYQPTDVGGHANYAPSSGSDCAQDADDCCPAPPQDTRCVSLAGKTVRFRFHYSRGHNEANPGRGLGWRIGTIAVMETRPVLNAALPALRVNTPYDPLQVRPDGLSMGYGPGTTLGLEAEVRNTGLLPASGLRVRFEARASDQPAEPLCAQVVPLEGILPKDGTATVRAACRLARLDAAGKVADDLEGRDVSFQATLLLDDDQVPDNAASVRARPVRATPDAALVAEVSPVQGPGTLARALAIQAENRGNVPLAGFTVFETLTRSLQAQGVQLARQAAWSFQAAQGAAALDVGQRRLLSDPALGASPDYTLADRFFTAGKGSEGDYLLRARLADVRWAREAGGATTSVPFRPDGRDANPGNDQQQASFQVLQPLYANGFDEPAQVPLPGVVQGALEAPAPWGRVEEDGPRLGVLRAGDPASGELPAWTNASALLPALDLTGARAASLALRHDYGLEAGFDGARVELSADGGATWETLAPRASLLGGGYPATPLVGASALLGPGGRADPAFTGQSGEALSEFDLARAAALQRPAAFARFDLVGLADRPSALPRMDSRGDQHFYGDGWAPAGTAPEEGWRIENVTLNEPRPHSGTKMWWSGSPGVWVADRIERVQTGLRLALDLTPPDVAAKTTVVSWFDWRAGWQDTPAGTGGLFRVYATPEGGARVALSPRLEVQEPGGWSLRTVELGDPFRGKRVTLELNYSASFGDGTPPFAASRGENAEGWFIDDLDATAYADPATRTGARTVLATQDMEGDAFPLRSCLAAGPFTAVKTPHLGPDGPDDDALGDQGSSACWSVARRGAARGGGWHIQNLTGPAGDPVLAWRMSSPDRQGYPSLANTRLVTPAVDLRQVIGTSARLSFDHRFGFQATQHATFARPGDGGIVEAQVFDEATGAYGPWQLLANGTLPPRLVVSREGPFEVESLQKLRQTGYATLYLQEPGYGNTPVGSPFPAMPGLCERCVGDPFGVPQWVPFAVKPAFSGDSGGWRHADWDVSSLVGKKVRFAFHAWTDPDGSSRADGTPYHGWSVANVSVRGTVFAGAPVLVRLRVATDGSGLEGQWTVADIQASGALFQRRLAIAGPGSAAPVRLNTSAPPVLPFAVENRGLAGRSGLALAVAARERATKAPVNVTLVAGLPAIPPANVTLKGVGDAYGPFSLTRIGTAGDRLAAELHFPSAAVGRDVEVAVQVLEDGGLGAAAYGKPNDEGAGAAASWTVRRADEVALAVEPTGAGAQAIEAAPGPNGTFTLRARAANLGTVAANVVALWAVRWDGGAPVTLPAQQRWLAPGERWDVDASVAPPAAALRANATLLLVASAGASATAWLEIPAARTGFGPGVPPVSWQPDFLAVPAGQDLPPGWSGGGFTVHRVPGQLSWGADPAGGAYCDLIDCKAAFQATAVTAGATPIDLSRPLNGKALLVLRHATSFAPGDGALLEASFVVPSAASPTGYAPAPCRRTGQADRTDWVPLRPTSGTLANGEPGPLSPLPQGVPLFIGALGQPDRPVTTVYDLLQQARWCADGTNPLGLVGPYTPDPQGQSPRASYRILLRHRVGIQEDADKPPHWGWLVAEERIVEGGLGLVLGPDDGGERRLPIGRNADKTYLFSVRNDLPLRQAFLATLDAPGVQATLRLPQPALELGAGETGTLRLEASFPEDAALGAQEAWLRVASLHDPRVREALRVVLDVDPLPKPDLSVELRLATADGTAEQGSLAQLSALVTNRGERAAKPFEVLFEAVDPDGAVQAIERVRVAKPLCAIGADDCPPLEETVSVPVEWSVPGRTGAYLLRATVDPDRRLLEARPEDNAATLPVVVKALQKPDLVLEDLRVEGVGPDGLVEDGALLVLRATVANRGEVPMPSSQVRLLAGAVTLTEQDLPALAPGATATATAVKVAAAGLTGQMVLRALALSTSTPESRIDNNDVRQVLTVRTHRLAVEAPAPVLPAAPGRTLAVPLTLRNAGNGVEQVALALHGLPGTWQPQVAPANLSVPPGGTALAVATLRVPALGDAGKWTATLVADGGAARATANITLLVGTRVAPAAVTLAESGLRTGPGNATLTIVPSSNVPERVRVEPAPGSLWGFPSTLVTLRPGRNATLSLAIDLPGQTPAGPAQAAVRLATLEGNWTKEATLGFQVLPTLRAAAHWDAPRPGRPGGDGTRAVRLAGQVENRGNLPFVASVTGELEAGARLEPPPPVAVAPGASAPLELVVRVNESAEGLDGSLRIGIEAQPGPVGQIGIPLPALAQQPDLTLRSVTLPHDLQAGERARVSFRVENIAFAASAPAHLHLYVDGLLAAAVPLPALEPGDGIDGEATVVLPAGSHLLTLVADGRQKVLELHEDNNGRSLAAEVERGSWLRAAPAGSLALAALALLATAGVRRRRAP